MCNRIIKSSRKCFKSILTIAVSGNILLSTAQYLIGIQRHENVPIQPLLPITFNANASCISLTFDPSDSLTKLAYNRMPSQICFRENTIAINRNIPSNAAKAPDLSLIRNHIIQSVFINCYESQKARVSEKWDGISLWPRIWHFARVIRNAYAHGGCINWTDTRVSPVSWKTLSYDCTKDNGRKITLKDIGEGDIIILIDELDKTFDE